MVRFEGRRFRHLPAGVYVHVHVPGPAVLNGRGALLGHSVALCSTPGRERENFISSCSDRLRGRGSAGRRDSACCQRDHFRRLPLLLLWVTLLLLWWWLLGLLINVFRYSIEQLRRRVGRSDWIRRDPAE